MQILQTTQFTVQMNLPLANAITGGLSKPSKMPGMSYGISANHCITGSKLRLIKGTTCNQCYAYRGHYTIPNIHNFYERRYELVMLAHNDGRDFEWIEAMVYLINAYDIRFFRWFDSGDLQGTWMIENICEVVKRTPHIIHWLPTQEKDMLQEYFDNGKSVPSNLVIRLSAEFIDGKLPLEFARKYEIVLSGVSRKIHTCKSPEQENKCLDCRKCWDKNVLAVIYQKH